MTPIKDEGIIIGIQELKDKDLIVRWITKDYGRLDAVARSAKSSSSRFVGGIGLYNKCQLMIRYKAERELQQLSEVTLSSYPSHLIQSLPLLNAVTALCEVIEQFTEKQTPIPEIYEHLLEFIYVQSAREHVDILKDYIGLEVRLFSGLGILPHQLPDELLEFLENPKDRENTSSLLKRYLNYTEAYISRAHSPHPQKRVKFLGKNLFKN